MARLVEPGFRVAGTVDAVELEGRVADHRVDLVTNNKCSGILVEHLYAVAGVQLEARCLGQVADTYLARGALGAGGIASLVVCRGVGARLDIPARTGRLAGVGESSSCKDFVTIQVNDREVLATGPGRNIVELLFRVFGQVSRLVDTDTAYAQVLGVTICLVQRVGDNPVRHKVLGHRTNFRYGIVLLAVGRVLAETFNGTAIVGSGSIPLHGPNRSNQIIRCRLLLVNSGKT